MRLHAQFTHDDDSWPAPSVEQVEREFLGKTGDVAGAEEWLAELGIKAEPLTKRLGKIALVQSWFDPTESDARDHFHIYSGDQVGPKWPEQLAFPIRENGQFIDLLLIDCYWLTSRPVCSRANWLGRDNFGRDTTIRLHRDPLDWLAAGCEGVCHIEPVSRKALTELAAATTILCNDLPTALEAWEWGFGGAPDDLSRFEIDDEPESIRAYFERRALGAAITELRETARRSAQ
jgi:hypothetical protein